jgi:hypothetical protein
MPNPNPATDEWPEEEEECPCGTPLVILVPDDFGWMTGKDNYGGTDESGTGLCPKCWLEYRGQMKLVGG